MGVPHEQVRKLRRGALTGQFLTVLLSEMSGTTFFTEEFRNKDTLRLGMTSKGLPVNCDGCEASFSMQHMRKYKKRGRRIHVPPQ